MNKRTSLITTKTLVGVANFRNTHQKSLSSVPTIGMAKEMTIDLSKITLRPYKISDVDDFLMYGGDDKVTRFTRWNTFTSKGEALSLSHIGKGRREPKWEYYTKREQLLCRKVVHFSTFWL
jgi:hypothetical protein